MNLVIPHNLYDTKKEKLEKKQRKIIQITFSAIFMETSSKEGHNILDSIVLLARYVSYYSLIDMFFYTYYIYCLKSKVTYLIKISLSHWR